MSETLEDAWQRILAMKNSEADQRKLIEVKAAMAEGLIGREPSSAAKRFSKAEALRLHKQLADRQRESKLAELVANTPSNYILADTIDKLAKMADDIRASDLIAFDLETFGKDGGALDPWKGEIAGFSVTTQRANYYVPIAHVEETDLNAYMTFDVIGMVASALMASKIVMHNAPFDCKWFYVKYGVNLIDSLHADTRIMAMSLDENRSHRLKDLLTDWLKEPSDNFDELFPNTQFNEVPLDVALVYAAGDTEKTLKLYEWISKWYDSRPDLREIKRLFYDVEMPVARQFIWSDIRGIKFDSEGALALDEKLAKEEAELQSKIYETIGKEINLNSPAQVSEVLFEELKLTDLGNGSTNQRFLNRIKGEHKAVELLLEYKEIGKLRSSFTQKLPREVKSDGRIHPWHNTWGAATGRFTCSDPNTQQIPAKRPEVRHLFLANGNDRILVSMDYSQIELRVLAHMANEKVLIDAFEHGRDIHSTTAALISNGKYSYEDIETEKDTDGHECQKLRKRAKIVNFGIVYGMGAGKLADTLEVSKAEAQKIIDDYFRGYPGIKRYMDEQHRLVEKQGFVTDIFGRKRRLHDDIKASKKDRWRLFSAQRQAGNFPIQASAGSILKKAVVDLQAVLPKYDTHIILQVHDELNFDCPRDISREALHEIRAVLENAVKLHVPVRCDIEIYPYKWAEKIDEKEWFSDERNPVN
ncbi:DNA-directed DNA polymerase [Bacillus sp. FJAT-49870]|uniref:DNA polymerase I n=2 Tax=Lederbergia citri TaxID=2833580 RepID=A0A942TFA7_9BACI|nr:DNA-directed DNA polymerase [Lederbergia citri]